VRVIEEASLSAWFCQEKKGEIFWQEGGGLLLQYVAKLIVKAVVQCMPLAGLEIFVVQ
jgi:hypothetical protein